MIGLFFLLRLSVAALLVTSALTASAGTAAFPATPAAVRTPVGNPIEDFLNDPQIQAVAPHLVQQMTDNLLQQPRQQAASAVAAPALNPDGSLMSPSSSAPIVANTKIPLLNDIVKIVSITVFNAKHADWSRLEAAKLRAIQTHGEEAVNHSADLNALDTHHAAVIVKTIYDTVINIPATTKAVYAAHAAGANPEAKDKERLSSSSSFWDFLGCGLVKSSEAIKSVKSLVNPSATGCETTDAAYLRGVDEVVYYSALSDGVAGGTLAAAPGDSAVKSLGLGTIIASVGKLAIELHMVQAVARLADLNPADDIVRTMIYLALEADSAQPVGQDSPWSVKVVGGREGAGQATGGPRRLSGIPVLRNLFAFSSDVLSANDLGEVVKFVFCPETDVIKPAVPPSSAPVKKDEQIQQPPAAQQQQKDDKEKKDEAHAVAERDEAVKNAMEFARLRANKIKSKEL
ncbi:hypothetical protein BGX33_006656 [Mortierella sp. NVP41]|nr:hypothetical protein BGX33_006656 [Mortierella sp. NVP41]